MIRMPLFTRSLALAFGLLLSSNTVTAGGIQLFEESVSYLGNAFAGTAAGASDASTAFYNPAGLTRLIFPEIDGCLTGIDVDIRSTIDTATANSIIGLPFNLPPAPVMGYASAQAGSWGFIPALNFAIPFNRCIALGLSISSPFGLNTNYEGDTRAKYIATLSRLVMVDVGPSIAVRVARPLSLGVGVDIQYARLKANQKLPVGETLPPFPFGGPFPDGEFKNTTTDIGYGWNAGLLYEFTCATRVGLSYRSRVHHRPKGNASITVPPPLPSLEGNVFSEITFPDSVNFSFYHDFNPEWAALGSVNYTHWSLFDVVTLHYSGPIAEDIQAANLPLSWRDTYRYALAANYSPSCRWKLRTGIAFDKSPVRNAQTRTFRVPDSDRYWIGLGAQYKICDCLLVDAGYTHLFVKKARIDQTQIINLTNGEQLVETGTARIDASVNEVGVQLSWIFI
jgi:long-chain fatty acid transport protein